MTVVKKSKFLILSFLILSFLILPNISYAQLLPACTATGNCGICDIIDTAVKIFRWLLGILGGTALFLLVWHGFGWLTSIGNKEKIEATRKALLSTVVGIIIILASWIIVNIVLVILLTPPESVNPIQTVFSNSNKWYEYCTGANTTVCTGKGEGSPCRQGQFCLTRCTEWETKGEGSTNPIIQCVDKRTGMAEKFNCGLTDYYGPPDGAKFESACEFWSTHPQYEDYQCLTSSNCTTGKILGSEYCTKADLTCCFPNN